MRNLLNKIERNLGFFFLFIWVWDVVSWRLFQSFNISNFNKQTFSLKSQRKEKKDPQCYSKALTKLWRCGKILKEILKISYVSINQQSQIATDLIIKDYGNKDPSRRQQFFRSKNPLTKLFMWVKNDFIKKLISKRFS